MSIAYITEQYLTDIANAIRKKGSTADMLSPSGMSNAITNIGADINPKFKANIQQSDNQTIKCSSITAVPPEPNNGIYELTPDLFTIHFEVDPSTGYKAGELKEKDHKLASWGEIIDVSATGATANVNQFVVNNSTKNNTIKIVDDDHTYTLEGYSATLTLFDFRSTSMFQMCIKTDSTITKDLFGSNGALYRFFNKYKLLITDDTSKYGIYWNTPYSVKCEGDIGNPYWNISDASALTLNNDSIATIWSSLKTLLDNNKKLVVSFVKAIPDIKQDDDKTVSPNFRITIKQSDHQTIKLDRINFTLPKPKGDVYTLTPGCFTANFSITADKGYRFGTLSEKTHAFKEWGETINISATDAIKFENKYTVTKATINTPINFGIDGNIYTFEGGTAPLVLFDFDSSGTYFQLCIKLTSTMTGNLFESGGVFYNYFKNTKCTITRKSDGYGLYWNKPFDCHSTGNLGNPYWEWNDATVLSGTKDSASIVANNLLKSLNNGEELVVEFR